MILLIIVLLEEFCVCRHNDITNVLNGIVFTLNIDILIAHFNEKIVIAYWLT